MRRLYLRAVGLFIVMMGPCFADESKSGGENAMFSTPLQRVLKRGFEPGNNLADELTKIGDYTVSSKRDARAIVAALKQFPADTRQKNVITSPLHAVTGLFQDVEDARSPAFKLLRDEGIPELIRIFDALKQRPTDDQTDDLLFILKMLAIYGTHDGAQRVVEAARGPLKPDTYMWSVILEAYCDGNPERDFVFKLLQDPIPVGFIAVALLDAANKDAIAGRLTNHPFDTKSGKERMRTWLQSRNPEDYSYAHSVTAALPFIRGPEQDELLGLAREHEDKGVRIEAAWASAKLNRKIGWSMLVDYCRDVNQSSTAQQYLEELGRQDLIPPEVKTPEFQAKAQFSNWLAHPNELGKPPDTLEIVDHRQLTWPPDGETKPFWIIKFVLHDRTGLESDDIDCGLVGSATWCFFSDFQLRPPEDIYAIHCYWELEHAKLLHEVEADDPKEYAIMLKQWSGKPLENPVVTRIVEISAGIKYPQRLVALATATIAGNEGWVVLDGPRSQWYPKAEMPTNESGWYILNIHIGHRLLGFKSSPDRAKYLTFHVPVRTPNEIVVAYDRVLADLGTANEHRRKALLAGWQSPLGKHLVKYAEALEKTAGRQRSETIIKVYQRFLAEFQQSDDASKKDAWGFSCPLDENFDVYVDALIASGQQAEVTQFIGVVEPFLDHNSGYGKLGTAAFKAGDDKTAERLFQKLKASYEDSYRSEEMSKLAEIWHRNGKSDEAHRLLMECLIKIVKDAHIAKGSDREQFEDWFQIHRSTFVRLFPQGIADLKKNGIPDTTIQDNQ